MSNDGAHLSHTHVYNREVKAASNDSLSIILASIPAGSTVLDVGTGSGALGKALKEQRGCIVDGITYNGDEAQLAAPNYRNVLVLDLERQPVGAELSTAQYDYVVCADVLEHLRNAQDVLKNLGQLLKPGGKVVVSVPNVSHLGVILGLTASRFVRTREGLLDSTHVHFMDRQALLQLVQSAGFTVQREEAVQRNLVETEFAALNFLSLPHGVRDYLVTLADADIYQFVWTLAPQDALGSGQNMSTQGVEIPALPQIDITPKFFVQMFMDIGRGYEEEHCAVTHGVQREGLQTLSFPIKNGEDVRAIRLDFADRPGQMEFAELTALDADGKIVWRWSGDWAANQTYHQCEWTGVKGWWGGRMVRALGADPWVAIPLPASAWATVNRVELRMSSPQPMGTSVWMGLDMRQLQALLTTMADNLTSLQTQATRTIVALEDELQRSKNLAELRSAELSEDIAVAQRALSASHGQLDATQQELTATHAALASRLSEIRGIKGSTSWRVTAWIRWLSRKLHSGAGQ